MKAKVNQLNYTAEYPTLTALTSDISSEIKTKISEKVALTECMSIGRCRLHEISVYTNAAPDDRNRRATATVMFTIQLSCDILAGESN